MKITMVIEIVLYKINLKKLHQKDFLQWILRLRLSAPRRMTDAVFEFRRYNFKENLIVFRLFKYPLIQLLSVTSYLGKKVELMKNQYLSTLEKREALMRTYNQLTQTERYQIYALRKANKNPTEISRVLGRHKSTIYRELKRNLGKRGYRAVQAHQFAFERHMSRDRSRLDK